MNRPHILFGWKIGKFPLDRRGLGVYNIDG